MLLLIRLFLICVATSVNAVQDLGKCLDMRPTVNYLNQTFGE